MFDQVVRLFDGRDEEALAEARREWKRLKDEGRALSYWREGEDGGWDGRAEGRASYMPR